MVAQLENPLLQLALSIPGMLLDDQLLFEENAGEGVMGRDIGPHSHLSLGVMVG